MAAATPASNAPSDAPKSKPYDPVRTLEGMYNGLLTRIGYVLRDPKNFGESSPFIFAESQKRFHDALDDCEIRLLDVKWYLEQRLRENKVRREREATTGVAVAAEDSATKRKRDPVEDEDERPQVETPTKRQKPEQEEAAAQSTSTELPNAEPQQRTIISTAQPDMTDQPVHISENQPVSEEPEADKEQSKPVADKPQEDETLHESLAAPDPSLIPPDQDFSMDDIMKASPQKTPDDGFFESMFGAPAEEDDQMNNDGMPLEFINDSFALDGAAEPPSTDATLRNQDNTQSQQNQPSFLSGLEQYANQTDDMIGNQDFSLADSQYQDNTNLNANHEPNIFDQFLDGSFEDLGNLSGGELGNMNIANPEEKNMNWDDLFDE